MLLLVLLQVLSLAAISKRATSIQVWAQHSLVWAQQLAGLSHEVNTTHHHHLGISFSSLTSQSQTVAHEVGNILNLSYRVVVSQDYRILLLAETANLFLQVQGLVNRFVNVSFLNPFFFHHNIYIIFLFISYF